MNEEAEFRKQITPENLSKLVKHIPIAMWISNPEGKTFWLNSYWHDTYEAGAHDGDEHSAGWFDGMNAGHDHHVQEAFKESVRELKPFKCEYQVPGTEGSPKWVLNSAIPSWDEAGVFAGYCGAIIDVSDRVEARMQAEAAEKEKSAVIRRLAHEIRNPLSPVRTAIDLLKRSEDPEFRDRLLEMMEGQLAEVSGLLSDLLDVASVTDEEFSFSPQRLSLHSLLSDLLADRNGDFLLGAMQDRFEVIGDLARLRQIINALLNNAKKSDPGSPPKVNVSRDGNTISVVVSDLGEGFSEEEARSIFGEFTGDAEGTTVGKGLGVGLSVARRLARLHRGDLRASSDGSGKGASFTLELPTPVANNESSKSPSRVLVVDDNPNILAIFQEYLIDCGFKTRVAGSAEMALKIAEDFSPDVCLCDISLPEEDGFSVAQQLRARFPQMKLFSISGFADQGTLQGSAEAGFIKHYIKPISAEQFVADLNALL